MTDSTKGNILYCGEADIMIKTSNGHYQKLKQIRGKWYND